MKKRLNCFLIPEFCIKYRSKTLQAAVDSWGKIQVIVFLSIVLGSVILISDARSDDTVDHTIYADLLKQHVKDGIVDYRGFKDKEKVLDQYLKLMEGIDTKRLARNEQFAFYVNAYNAWTIKLILTTYPGIKSIKELGSIFKSPWGKKICRIDGGLLTLDDIEHNILRPRFRDSRIHFAVNCASKSCPPLRSKPYAGEKLDQQLDEMTESFINDPEYNYLKDNTLYVSSIFKWYAEDFNNVVDFFLKYAKGDFKNRLDAVRGKVKIKYLKYDWSLNGR